MLNVSIEDNGLMQRLEGIALRAGEIPQEVFQDIGQLLIRSQIASFEAGGRPTPWQESIRNTRTLRSPADRLMNSGEVSSVGKDHVEVSWGDSLPYRLIHFFGGSIQRTERMRKFFWAKFYESGRADEFWRNMAVSKKPTVDIPARRYLRIQDEDAENIAELLMDYVLGGERKFETIMK